jgi:uncharacterized protein YfiM (DUF2279 family)
MKTELRRSSFWLAARFLGVLSAVSTSTARADVIVLANRTETALSAVVTPAVGSPQRLLIASGESLPAFVDGRATVEFASRGRAKHYQLDANCAYYFGRARDGTTDLEKIGLGEDETTTQGRALPGAAAQLPPAVIPVKIYVDEEEAARQPVWERRLRQRIEAASMILERTCGVRLNVVAVGMWMSDDAMTDFYGALSEFEREANPTPGRIAIGFTSQFTPVVGRTHMAGTRGPLHPYILVREGAPQINEPERLEFLVHELGHYLGASHSPEPTSVMRPVLGDNRAGTRGFRIRFDPVNTLVMSMVSEELRRNNAQDLAGMTAETKKRLRQIYGELARTFPDDPASQHYVALMESSGRVPLAMGTRQVLDELSRAALANKTLPTESKEAGAVTRRSGDALTDYYVRRAAAAAKLLPADIAPNAFLLGLGIGLGDSKQLEANPATANLTGALEAPRERTMRLAMLGEPTILGRRDLAQHFFVSALLSASAGAAAAQAAGISKEMLDAQGESGFSFADLAADRAGIEFARRVADRRLTLPMLAQAFSVAGFVPSIEGLPEKLSAQEFTAQFSGPGDGRFLQQLQEIDRRILQLPAYRTGGVLHGQ